jgi:hypothetical protein
MNKLFKFAIALIATGTVTTATCFGGTTDKDSKKITPKTASTDKVIKTFTPKMATLTEGAEVKFVKNSPAFGKDETMILRKKDIEATYTFEITEAGKYYFNAVVRTGTSLKSDENIARTYLFQFKGKQHGTTFVKTIKQMKFEDKNYAVTVGLIQSGHFLMTKGKHSITVVNKVANAALSTLTLLKKKN